MVDATEPVLSALQELFLFDCSGHAEIYGEQMAAHWKQPAVLMVVFDVTNETSLANCEKWIKNVRSNITPTVECPGMQRRGQGLGRGWEWCWYGGVLEGYCAGMGVYLYGDVLVWGCVGRVLCWYRGVLVR